MLRLPYGVASFEGIRSEGCYYIDRTRYIPILEGLGKYLLLLRPRRFGKSMFLNTLAAYYDLNKKQEFAKLFAGLHIGRHPTTEANKYLILKFDFSGVSSDVGYGGLRESFINHVRIAALEYMDNYKDILTKLYKLIRDMVLEGTDSSSIIENILYLARANNQRVYLLIDEYDNFANELLSSGDEPTYKRLAQGTGFFKTFFKQIKAYTQQGIGIVAGVFITGVTPMLLDDLGSGFNNAKNISDYQKVNEIIGFTEEEVKSLGQKVITETGFSRPLEEILEKLRIHYNGYRFNRFSVAKVYNSTMVIYFFDRLLAEGRVPDELYDENVKTDYSKIKLLITVDRHLKRQEAPNGSYSILKQVIRDSEVSCRLCRSFRIDEVPERDNFISLLYYLGLLTIRGYVRNKHVLEIPNLGIRYLYWEYFREALRDFEGVRWDIFRIQGAVDALAYEGGLAEFEQTVIREVFKYLSHRDLQGFNERTIQCIWLSFLATLPVYRPVSEEDLGVGVGYSDLILVPEAEDVRYGYVIELKYVKKGAMQAEVDRVYEEAQQQIERYLASDKLKAFMRGKSIKTGIFVYKGLKVAKSNI